MPPSEPARARCGPASEARMVAGARWQAINANADTRYRRRCQTRAGGFCSHVASCKSSRGSAGHTPAKGPRLYNRLSALQVLAMREQTGRAK